MTWKEIDDAFKTDPVVLIPMGSTEQQGIQSLTGDYLAAEEIAKRVAEKSDAYYTSVIPFGCSEYFRCFPEEQMCSGAFPQELKAFRRKERQYL